MDICILSMQKVLNFGSLLQGYALRTILQNMGYKVDFIDIEPIKEDCELLPFFKEFIDEKEEGERGSIFNKLKKVDRYVIIRAFNRIRSKRQDTYLRHFQKNYLGIGEERKNEKRYDLCIIGSDEVFNCMQKSKWGFTSQLYGNVRQADHVITYAASCGATTLEEVPKQVKNRITQAFSQVEGFSVRDNNTKEFVSALTDQDVNINLDPAFVYDFSSEIEKAKASLQLPPKYCLVYSYPNRINNSKDINAIKKFCHEKKLEIIAVGEQQFWIRKYLVLTPFQLLYAFSKADFVITDTFHGTIFAAKYSQRFAVMVRRSNSNKLNDLIERIGVSKHRINSLGEIVDVYHVLNNLDEVHLKTSSEYSKTIHYLKENISMLNKSEV